MIKILTGFLIILSLLLFCFYPLSLFLTGPLLAGWLGEFYEMKSGGESKTGEEMAEADLPRCQECGQPLETEKEKKKGYCFNCEIEDEGIATINQA